VIPSLSHLPDGIRVKHLLKTFGGQVSDSLREVADSYTHTLKPVERLSVMLELLKTCPEDVFLLFHNTVAGEAEEVQKRLKGFLISEKSNRTLLYFSNSHKFPDTEGQNLILDPQKR
jgi:NMD protein affecting ribosome stability and mRNA decay